MNFMIPLKIPLKKISVHSLSNQFSLFYHNAIKNKIFSRKILHTTVMRYKPITLVDFLQLAHNHCCPVPVTPLCLVKQGGLHVKNL